MRPPGRALRPGGPAPRCQRPRPAATWPASGPVGGGRARRARSASRRGWPWAGPSRPRRLSTFASRPSGRPRGAAASRGARSSARTAEAGAPALSLRDGHGKTTCASRSAGPAAAATTPSPGASGRASRTRCTAGGRPRRATRRSSLASSGSRGSTTADARARRLGTGTRRT